MDGEAVLHEGSAFPRRSFGRLDPGTRHDPGFPAPVRTGCGTPATAAGATAGCSTGPPSISPGPTRQPVPVIESSERPTTRTNPSPPWRARSPVSGKAPATVSRVAAGLPRCPKTIRPSPGRRTAGVSTSPHGNSRPAPSTTRTSSRRSWASAGPNVRVDQAQVAGPPRTTGQRRRACPNEDYMSAHVMQGPAPSRSSPGRPSPAGCVGRAGRNPAR